VTGIAKSKKPIKLNGILEEQPEYMCSHDAPGIFLQSGNARMPILEKTLNIQQSILILILGRLEQDIMDYHRNNMPVIAVTFLLLFSILSIISGDVGGHSGDELDSKSGISPTIDGVLTAGEWDDADSVSYSKRIQDVTIYFKQDGNSFYVGFDIPDASTFDFDDSGVNVDLDHDGEGDPEDYFIEISRSGGMRERHVSETLPGPDEYNDYQNCTGWTAGVSNTTFGWQAEYMISLPKLDVVNGIDRCFGIAFHTLDGSNGEFDWPTTCHIRDPGTFADIHSSDYWDVKKAPPNQVPRASFTFSPVEPTVEDEIEFRDTSTDFDGNIVSWQWDFGDGTDSFIQDPVYQYTNAGTYQVSLTITDNDAGMNDITKQIIVKDVIKNEVPPKLDDNDDDDSMDERDITDEKKTPGFTANMVLAGIILSMLISRIRKRMV